MSQAAGPLTEDSLFSGRLTCKQYRDGYRFSIDAVLVAHFCDPPGKQKILDLGCGCGVISLILAYRHPAVSLTGIEIQPALAEVARLNITANRLVGRCGVIEGDLAAIGDLIEPESFDLVVSNPPYRQVGQGRLSPGSQRASARHGVGVTVNDVTRAAAFAVKNRGRIVFIYPARRTISLLSAMRSDRLEPKRIRYVYGHPASSEAALVLVEAVKNGGEEVLVMPPLYIYSEQNGPYTEEVRLMYD